MKNGRTSPQALGPALGWTGKTRNLLVALAASLILMCLQAPAEDEESGRYYGGHLIYGERGSAATLDPITGNDMISLRISELIFNGLTGYDETQNVVPELAESWEVLEGNRIYRFKLRRDVLWHTRSGDKIKFTADDVVYTFNVISHPKTITSLKSRLEFIKEVRKIDDYTVEFVLKRPIIDALGRLSFKIIPRGASPREYLSREDEFAQRPLGTGPYILESRVSAGDVTLTANEEYFKGKPHIDEIVMKPFSDSNIMTNSLLFGRVDMLPEVATRDIPKIQGDENLRLKPYNALSYAFFGYNLRNPLLKDRRVRQAITYAINREEMLQSFYQGRGTLISGPFAPGSWAYNLDVKPYPYDPERAKQLLAEAGFEDKDGDGILEKDGKPLKLLLKVPIKEDNEDSKRVILAFMNYLHKVGIEVKVAFREWQTWQREVFQDFDFDVILASWVFDDSSDISTLFHSGEIGPWRNNFGGYSNPEVDALITEAKITLDREKRRSINRKLHKILAEDQPYTFLWTLNKYAAYNRRIHRVEVHPFKFFTFVDKWYISE
ncbi:MAG: ABC transporter substrate-binding protein [bacterium]